MLKQDGWFSSKRFLVFDPGGILPAPARARIADCCEVVTALPELPLQARGVLLVTAIDRLADALATARALGASPACPITIGVADATPPYSRPLRVVELDSDPLAVRELASRLDHAQSAEPPADGLVGSSPGFLRVVDELARAAAAPSNVLVTGESGTGKELAARMIHDGSERARQPSVYLNCAAIPDALFESEMFGYQKGAFTGAERTEEGAFARAHRGTLVLDEVGDMSLAAQAKLLRAIETKRVSRLGSRVEIAADARIVALTNQRLDEMVAAGAFRRDLYFRLNVVRVDMPPLRDRPEDLPALVSHFTRHFAHLFRRAVEGVTSEVLVLFHRHPWPGNVRELRNVIEAAFVNRPGTWIGPGDLPPYFRRSAEQRECPSGVESARILSVLNECCWNKSHAAQKLHWSRMTLYRKMARYRITPPPMKACAQGA